MWVANDGESSVSKLLASTGPTPVGTYRVGTNPWGVAFDGVNIWVTNWGGEAGQTVTKLLASTGAEVGTYQVGKGPTDVAFDGTNIWVTNWAEDTVTKLLASTGAVVGTYQVGSGPMGIAFDGTNVWTATLTTAPVPPGLLASTGELTRDLYSREFSLGSSLRRYQHLGCEFQ